MNSEQALYDTAKAFGEAFTVAADYAESLMQQSNNEAEPNMSGYSDTIERLKNTYSQFNDALYKYLEPITDWNQQNDYFEIIRRFINDDRMFNNTFNDWDTLQEHKRAAPAGVDGIRLINLLNALNDACGWYGEGRYRLVGFCENYRRKQSQTTFSVPQHQNKSTVIIPPGIKSPEESQQKKNVLPRNSRIALLYELMRRTGIASTVNNTDISAFIECVTGGNPSTNARGNYASKHLHDDIPQEHQYLLDSIVPPRRK